MLCTIINFFSDYETRLSKSDEDNLDDDDDDEVNPAIEKAMNALKFVAQHVKNQDNFNSVSRQNENEDNEDSKPICYT